MVLNNGLALVSAAVALLLLRHRVHAQAAEPVCCKATTTTSNFSSTMQQQITKHFLLEKLKSDYYDSSLPPNYPQNTVVSISHWYYALHGLDEHSATVTHASEFTLTWRDERLAWLDDVDMQKFPYQNGPLTFRIDNEQDQTSPVWIPRLFMHGRLQSLAQPFLYVMHLRIFPNGTVKAMAVFEEPRHCLTRTKRFPFDQQDCNVMIEAYQKVTLNNDNLLSLEQQIEYVRLQPELYETGEWKFYDNIRDDISAAMSSVGNLTVFEDSSTIEYKVTLYRKLAHGQHVINWICLPIFVSVTSVIGMYCGCRVGERFGFGGTMMLSMSVMNDQLTTALGVGANGYPILGQLFIGLQMSLMLATLLSSVPSAWQRAVRSRFAETITTEDEKSRGKQWNFVDFVSNGMHRNNWSRRMYDGVVMSFVLALQGMLLVYVFVRYMTSS